MKLSEPVKSNQIVVYKRQQGKKIGGSIFNRKTGQLFITINRFGCVKRSNKNVSRKSTNR